MAAWDPENRGKWHVSAYHDMRKGPGAASHVEAHLYTDTPEEAQEIASKYPKSSGVRAGSLGGVGEERNQTVGNAMFRATLQSNGVNGGVNETGMKRYGSLRRTAEKLGHETAYSPNAKNSYPTEEDFNKAVGPKTPATDPSTLFSDRRS